MMGRYLLLVISAAVFAAGCTTSIDTPDIGNKNEGGPLSAPQNFDAQVSDNSVRLVWEANDDDEEDAVAFAVYRREVNPADGRSDTQIRVAETSEMEYTDGGVRNGRRYAYQVSAAEAAGGPYGDRTEEILVTPGLFSMVINNGQPYTTNRNISVQLTAPPGLESGTVQFSEDPDPSGASAIAYAPSRTWTLTNGDGLKTLYAVLRTSDGTRSQVISDAITLDTQVIIQSVDFVGPEVRSPGESIHFILDAGEPDGDASVSVSGIFTRLVLFDDGTGGDPVAGDGLYERTTTIPLGARQDQAEINGSFTDAAGNGVGGTEGLRPLTVAAAPDQVSLSPPIFSEPPAGPSVTLRWTKSQIPDFDLYQLFRDTTPAVDSTDRIVASTTLVTTVELNDNTVAEGLTYYYRLFVRNEVGLLTGSNIVQADVPNVRSPEAVTLSPVDGVAEDRLGLNWSRSDAKDFAAYRLYRSTDGFVDQNDNLITTITDQDKTRYTDTGLVENTEYFYRIFVDDTAGLSASSSQISGTTKNLAPAPVALMDAAQVDTMAATLSWEASDAHDFEAYRLFRDLGPGVGTFSTLVVEVKESDVLTFRDTDLEPGTTYYYRVFVADDGTNPGPKVAGSNVISLTTDETP